METRDFMQNTVRVLIADDSEEDRVLFRHILKTFDDFEVVGTTVNGVDTIAYLDGLAPYNDRRTYKRPDLILLDFQMPGLSGLDVIRQLRGQPHPCKVVLWTDALELVNQPLAYQLGASVVCEKPQIRSDFVSILTRALTAPAPPVPPRSAHTDGTRSRPHPVRAH